MDQDELSGSPPPPPQEPPNSDTAQRSGSEEEKEPAVDEPSAAVSPDLQMIPPAVGVPPGFMLVPSGASYLPPGIGSGQFMAQQMVTAQFRSSPFPPPEEIEVLERHYLGATKRIFDLVEQRQTAEIDLAKSGQKFQRDDTRRGNWMGYTVILFVLIAASALFYTGHGVGGSALLVADVLGVGGALYMQNPEIFRIMKRLSPDQSASPAANGPKPDGAEHKEANPQ